METCACGATTAPKRYIKGGIVACKCRKCGKLTTQGKVERAPESPEARERKLKAAYEASLQAALRAKYDVLFNYAAEGDADVPALVAECLKLKKQHDRARQDAARALEVPNAAKLLAIDLEKQLNPPPQVAMPLTAHAGGTIAPPKMLAAVGR